MGRFRELSSWRKEFKKDWLRAVNTLITAPLNPKYRPDPHHWVCTVAPTFFLEVNRNRTTPFWIHQSLIPLDSRPPPIMMTTTPVPKLPALGGEEGGNRSDDEDCVGAEEDLMDTCWQQLDARTFQERMLAHVKDIRNFTLERNGSSFLRLVDSCLSRERRENSSRSRSPTTWEKETASAMYYRVRPSPSTYSSTCYRSYQNSVSSVVLPSTCMSAICSPSNGSKVECAGFSNLKST